jgi:type I restriction enzyme S subunit
MIPDEWEVKLLPDVCRFRGGKAHEQHISEVGRFVCVNSKFISTDGKVRKYCTANFCSAKKDDVLMVMSDLPNGRALAKAFLVEQDNLYAVNQRVCALTAYRDCPKFLFYTLNRSPYFLKFDDGVNQTHLLNHVFQKCPLPIPPTVAEQEAIAGALSDVDALISALDQLIAKKRDLKQAAMQQLLAPPAPGQNRQTRLPGFHAEWSSRLMPDVCWFQEGPGVRNTQFTSFGVKLLNGTNIFRGRINLDTTDRFISEREARGPYAHFLADSGDIVIACSGISVEKFHEKVAVVTAAHLPFCMNTSTMRFKPDLESLLPTYLCHFLMSDRFKSQIGPQATGSAQLNFGPSHVTKVELHLPGVPEQTAIAEVLSDLDAELAALEQRRDKTRALKQGMMQELLTGRTRLV